MHYFGHKLLPTLVITQLKNVKVDKKYARAIYRRKGTEQLEVVLPFQLEESCQVHPLPVEL